MRRRGARATGGRSPVPAVRLLLDKAARAGLSRYGLAKISGVDERYLARLEEGAARRPGRDMLIKLGLALVSYTSLFKRQDVEEVLKAAGEPPSPDYLWAERVYVVIDGTGRGYASQPRWPA